MADLSRLPIMTLDAYEWQFEGACRQANLSLFFHPEGERGPSRIKRDAAAVAICAGCPVIEECRQHGLAVREPFGVWGGLTEDDREELYRLQRQQAREDADSPGLAETG